LRPYEKIVVHSGPDKHGRFVHTRYWWSDYTPGHPEGEYERRLRGQVFRAPLPDGAHDVVRSAA